MSLDEGQRGFVHKTMEKFGVIEVKGPQWRISPTFLSLLEMKLATEEPFDAIKKLVEEQYQKESHEIRTVIQSFVMEFVVRNFSNITMPEVKDTDIKDTRDLINYLMEEEKKNLK